MSQAHPLGDFGARYFDAVMAANPGHKGTVRLAWWLVNEAYIRQTLRLTAGELRLCKAMKLYRSALAAARDELVALGLLDYTPHAGGRSGSRSEYTLTLPLPTEARRPTRAVVDSGSAPVEPRASEDGSARESAPVGPRTYSGSSSYSNAAARAGTTQDPAPRATGLDATAAAAENKAPTPQDQLAYLKRQRGAHR